MKIRHLPFLLLVFFAANSSAQKWISVENSSFRHSVEQRQIIPEKYESYNLDFVQFKSLLNTATKRFESNDEGIEINWPMPGNKFQQFKVKRSDVFHPKLASKYPNIRAYTGKSTTDPTATLKMSISHKGIEGMLLSDRHETIYLDRYSPKNKENYILYKRSNYHRELAEGEGQCTVEIPDDGFKGIDNAVRFGDCQLRKYRLALACTGEYATFHGGNVPDVLAEFNASMIRVNGIYERDFAITMELIVNTDELIFLTASTDPYTNNDGSAMLGQNQATCDQIIGTENYDIGHVYSTGGGGIASLRSPCTTRKARGVTGLGNPTGDFFWVDYVAHEMGHQFGGNHTFNNSCGNNRSSNTAFEPGSGSTIMAYAGICSPNVQNNSDDYFHAASQSEVANFVVAGNGSCAEIIFIDNSAPEIESITATGQILPSRTPFFLTAVATDADNDMLTYCWEQMNNGIAPMPPESTATLGPAFRSYDPSENPTRYFPRLSSILTGINGTTWEVLPNADRNMKFNVTVRDNNLLGGCTADEDLNVSFVSSAGPFLITSQNTSTTWNSGDVESITWDVANTDIAPISCTNVDILFSLDRGENFDIILAENVPNDGEHEIIVPFQFSAFGRIMIKCSSRTFFDINNRDINVIAPFSATITPELQMVCPEEVATFTIDYTVFGDNPIPATFDLEGLPAGATFNFNPGQVDSDTVVTLIIDGLTSDLAGLYHLEIIVQGNMVTQIQNVTLIVAPDQNTSIVYQSPAEGQTGVSISPVLSWETLAGITNYEVEVDLNPKFDNPVFTNSTSNNFTIPSGLSSMRIYYWRVRGVSPCTAPEWDGIQSFQTGGLSCDTDSIEANIIINSDEGNTIESEIILNDPNLVGGLEVSMQINHTWIGDLSGRLKGPNGLEISLFDRPGVPTSEFGCDGDNIMVTFSSGAVNTHDIFENTCSNMEFGIEGTFQPMESLSLFDNIPISGTWTLIIEDALGPDGGELVNWSITTCVTTPLDPGVILKNNILQLNNQLEGTITDTLLSMETQDSLNAWYIMRSITKFGEILKWNETSEEFDALGIGDSFNQNDVNQNRIKYVLMDQSATDDSFNFDTEDDMSRYTSNNTFLITATISPLAISASITNQISCFGATDGRITVMGLGGIPGYTFKINDGPFEEQSVFENLIAGEYTITVKDEAGNEFESEVLTIVEPNQITYEIFIGNNEIMIGAEGGTGTLMYSLDGINYTSESIISIFDGDTYQIHVRDENGCEAQSTEMTYYKIGGAEFNVIPVNCKGDESGVITIFSVDGGLEPYTYQLENQSPIIESTFTGLAADTYEVTIRDNSGSTFTITEIIVEEPEFLLEITITIQENSVILAGTGGSGEYLYSINSGSLNESGAFDLPEGTYIGTVFDGFGCSASIMFTIMTSSTNEPILDNLNLYPNPANAVITLGSSNQFSFDYQLIDITGKIVAQHSASTNNVISIDFLPAGLFLVKVIYRDASKVFKLSKL